MDQRKFLVCGASVAAGTGLPDGKLDSNLWCNLLCANLKFTDIINVSKIGIDNQEIFLETTEAIKKHKNLELIIVQWQTIPYLNLNIGLELYQTRINLIGTGPILDDINLVSKNTVSSKNVMKIRKELMLHYNQHWEIKNLVNYCNILIDLASNRNINIKFINYNLPWGHYKFFNKIHWQLPSDLDEFTYSLLDADLRNDSQCKDLYNLIHNDYERCGGINEQHWLNLYDPLQDHQIDDISKIDKHPGVKSQFIFASKIKAWLDNSQCYKL